MSSACGPCGYHPFCTTDRHPRLRPPPLPSKSVLSQITTTGTQTNSLSHQLKLTTFNTPLLLTSASRARLISNTAAAAAARSNVNSNESEKKKEEDEVEEVEEDMPWIQEKALDIVEFSGSVTQALPGPRVGQSSVPWILALPLAYVGISFVFSVYKTIRKLTSPKQARRKLVSKNAELCRSIDELLEKEGNLIQQEALKGLTQKTGFSTGDILRKYIRYSLNEKPFNPKLVAALIQLRKSTMLDDSQVAELLNEISRRIVKDYGPVVMDTSGYSEKGLRRKLAVQALFGKIFYLSEMPEFCAKDSSLIVKEIFGVADEDAEKLRLHTVAEAGDMGSLEKMVDGSDSEDSDSNSFGYDMGWWKEEHFNASDADGDGFLNTTEFNDFQHPADTKNPRLLLWLCKEEVSERDTDKDGRVNFKEFFRGLFDMVRNYDEDAHNTASDESSDSLESPARSFFAQLDKDGDGFLSDVELLPIIGKLHPSERYYAKQQADYIISQADTDKDGRLSLTEMIDSPYVFYSAIFNGDEDEDSEYHEEFR